MAHTASLSLTLALQSAVFLLTPLALRHAAGPYGEFRTKRQLPLGPKPAPSAADSVRFAWGVPFSIGRQTRRWLAVSAMEIFKDAALTHGDAFGSVRLVGVGGAPG